MGEFIDPAFDGVRSVLAEVGTVKLATVAWPGWRTVIGGAAEKIWIRADADRLVDMRAMWGTLVREGEHIATITNPFKTDDTVVEAPFTGLLVGILEKLLVYPDNPLCHLVKLDDRTLRAIERNRTSPTRCR